MATLASILEQIGANARTNVQGPKSKIKLMQSLGISSNVAHAVAEKHATKLKLLANVPIITCCYIARPTISRETCRRHFRSTFSYFYCVTKMKLVA